MLSQKLCQFWTIVLLGVFYFNLCCDARAVNVSNTWTMPQEGLNVFYRFFRDRISWFEADAVCQFHHANLVTVDNSFQFDATRDLLRELDVNDIVWIGLMRPQSSERFMWSNSRPLVTDTGYWAESLPLMDAPLCAVIDPIRDYRWHALRCGGPETASFLCEMPVPAWADACILRDMPNLTMQYMADTASIELIRNCEEEGMLKQTCKGKQDREHVLRELLCPRERLETQRINDITNSHFKSLQIINSIRTDNNENNDIELLPLSPNYGLNSEFIEQVPTEKNTVQRLIEQFNVDELMQADEPSFKIPGEIPKPVKKSGKKVVIASSYPKKEKTQKYTDAVDSRKPKKEQKLIDLDDMMMGDQPHGEPELQEHIQDDEVSNEIMELLPHKKKILPQDLKTMPTITEKPMEKSDEDSKSDETKSESEVLTTINVPIATTTLIPSTTAATIITSTEESITTTIKSAAIVTTEQSVTTKDATSAITTAATINNPSTTLLPATTLPPATIGHPMHPQQPRSNIITEETQHPHVKESADNSHFIPPMLLVKSHYVPPPRHEHSPSEHRILHDSIEKLPTTTTVTADSSAAEQQGYATTASDMAETITTTGKVAAADGMTTAIKQDETTPINAQATQTENIAVIKSEEQATNAKIIDAETSRAQQQFGKHKDTTNLKHAANNNTTTDKSVADQTTATILMATAATNLNPSETLKTAENIPTIAAEQKEIQIDKTTTVNQAHETTTIKVFERELSATTIQQQQQQEQQQHEQLEEKAHKLDEAIKTTEKPETKKIQTETSDVKQDKQETIVMTTDAPIATTTTTAATTKTTQIKTISTAHTTISATTNVPIVTTTTTTTQPLTTTTQAPITTQSVVKTTTTTTMIPTTVAAGTTEIQTETVTPTRNFLKDETETPFKPNRRRSLTKPETVSYFKKLLG